MVDGEAIAWAFRLLLGREPDAGDIEAGTQAWGSVAAMRAALLSSPEFLAATGRAAPVPGRFESRTAARPRVMVISNCQGPELARHLSSITGCATIGRDVTTFTPAQADQWLADGEACDAIVSVPLSEQFDGIRLHQLRQRFGGKLVSMSAPYFEGLFPDTITLGRLNQRIASPMIAHSGLILRAYLTGADPSEAPRSFNAGDFARFGYLSAWDTSEQEFRRREAGMDIAIADRFFARVRSSQLLVTINHPTAPLYRIVCEEICRHLDLPFIDVPLESMATVQAFQPIWPVSTIVAEHHGLAYRTAQIYIRENEAFDIAEFSRRSYAAYDLVGRDALIAAVRQRGHKVFADIVD